MRIDDCYPYVLLAKKIYVKIDITYQCKNKNIIYNAKIFRR